MRIPPNIGRVRVAMLKRIIHKDLNVHPYKMMEVQHLSKRNKVNEATFCENFINFFTHDIVLLMCDEAHFIYWSVNNQNYH